MGKMAFGIPARPEARATDRKCTAGKIRSATAKLAARDHPQKSGTTLKR